MLASQTMKLTQKLLKFFSSPILSSRIFLTNRIFTSTKNSQIKIIDIFKFITPIRNNREKNLLRDISDRSNPDLTVKESLGYAKFNFNQILIKDVVTECERQIDYFQKNSGINSSTKKYLQDWFDPKLLTDESSILKLACNEKIIQSASAYLSCYPILHSISIFVSPPNEKTQLMKGSQLFHRDQADEKIYKLWVLIDDIDHDDGPLTVLDSGNSHKIASSINYHEGSYLEDAIFQDVQDKLFYVKGHKGDVFVTDTCSCFHFGSRVMNTSKSRKLLMIQYTSPYSIFYLPFLSGNSSKKSVYDKTSLNELNAKAKKIGNPRLIKLLRYV